LLASIVNIDILDLQEQSDYLNNNYFIYLITGIFNINKIIKQLMLSHYNYT